MDLDRDGIVRRDFKRSLRGYDEWEVETHLKQVNQAVSVLIDGMLKGNGDLPPAVQERLEARVTLAQAGGGRAGRRRAQAGRGREG